MSNNNLSIRDYGTVPKYHPIIPFFERLIEDDRLYPSHISMYVSLFQLWSLNHFQNPFRISRVEVMKLSKIRSFATYHKCVKELSDAGFIAYSPSYDSYKGSVMEIIDQEKVKQNKSNLPQDRKLQAQEEASFSEPMVCEVELYFAERNLLSAEAHKFYRSYQSQHWKLSNEKPMKCWQAAARNWILNLKNKE